MENLKKLSEITTRYGNRNVNELEFSSPEDFKKYKAKHKMRPGTVVKVAGKDKVIGDEPKKSKRKSVPLDFQMANEKEVKQMAKKYGLEIDSIEGNPNAGLEVKLTGDEEALKKFMTSDDYGMDDRDAEDHIGEFGSDSEANDFNGVDYGKMKGKEPGAFDRNAVSNLLSGNPELEKELGVKSSDDYEKQRDVLGKLDLEKISKIIDKYGNDDDKESHIDRLKDDHGLESDDAKKMSKDMDKAAGDANKKMAKAELDDAIDQGDGDGAMELFQSEIGFKKMGKDGKEAKKLLDRMADYDYGLINLNDKELDGIQDRLKELSKKYLGESVKYSGKYDIQSLSRITTRYNK